MNNNTIIETKQQYLELRPNMNKRQQELWDKEFAERNDRFFSALSKIEEIFPARKEVQSAN